MITVTICETLDVGFSKSWEDLVKHAENHGSDIVLLPELPAYPWFAKNKRFDERIWREAVKTHEEFISNLDVPFALVSTRPVQFGNLRLNQFLYGKNAIDQLETNTTCQKKGVFTRERGFTN